MNMIHLQVGADRWASTNLPHAIATTGIKTLAVARKGTRLGKHLLFVAILVIFQKHRAQPL